MTTMVRIRCPQPDAVEKLISEVEEQVRSGQASRADIESLIEQSRKWLYELDEALRRSGYRPPLVREKFGRELEQSARESEASD
jgi:hypothetical protein